MGKLETHIRDGKRVRKSANDSGALEEHGYLLRSYKKHTGQHSGSTKCGGWSQCGIGVKGGENSSLLLAEKS